MQHIEKHIRKNQLKARAAGCAAVCVTGWRDSAEAGCASWCVEGWGGGWLGVAADRTPTTESCAVLQPRCAVVTLCHRRYAVATLWSFCAVLCSSRLWTIWAT